LIILRWVAANSVEIVGECEGKDFDGHQIICFLVFMHFQVCRPEDVIFVEGVRRLCQYPAAPDSQVFTTRAQSVEELSAPGPFGRPLRCISPGPSSGPSSNFIWGALCSVCSFLQLIPNFLFTVLHCSS
jgi:hypothetical protein